MVKNLCQGACADATDFMIRVGSSIGNLAKDWKGQITEAELQSLQYEVSLNGVREEIRHVLDSEIARHGQLTPHQMYEAVKRYETYVACNKCLKGRAPALTLVIRGLWLRLLAINLPFTKPLPSPPQSKGHQTLLLLSRNPLFPKKMITWKWSQPRKGMKDYIPNFLEEALGGDGNLQIKMARTMQAQERHDRKCFICQLGDHLIKDCYKGKNGAGPLQLKGPLQNKSAWEMAKASLPG